MAAVGIRVGVVAVGALALSLAFGWARLVPLSLVALGGMYALQLAIDDEPLDASAPLVAAGLLLTAELAYWSCEERDGVRAERGETLRRVGLLAGLAVASVLLATTLLALVDAVRTQSLALDVLGAAAAAGTLVLVVLLARRATSEEG